MSRMHLFHGKRVDNGEWIEGYLMDENYINQPFNDNDVGGRFDEPVEVIPETVGQYTGKDDKNGKKIFEGCIALVSYLANGEIIEERVLVNRDNENTAFVPWNWQYNCDGCECGLEIQEVEIVGNFYDNPELLSG